MDSQENLAVPVVVSAPAQIDPSTVAQLRAALLAPDGSCPAVVLDMSQTVFCDSAGISMLVQARNRAEADGGEVRLVITSASVLRTFALIGVDQLFPISPACPPPWPTGPSHLRPYRRWKRTDNGLLEVKEGGMVKTRIARWVGRWRERRLVREQTRQTSAARQAKRAAEASHPLGHGGSGAG